LPALYGARKTGVAATGAIAGLAQRPSSAAASRGARA